MSEQLRMRYEGDGVFRAATKLDYEKCLEAYSQGDVLRAELSRPRSITQNNYFHALVEAAWDNQRGGPRFGNWRTLKGYLLVRAEHSTERRMKLPRGTPRSVAVAIGSGLALLIRHSADYIGISYDPKANEIVARFPGSMKFHGPDALSSDDASEIIDKVIALICTEIVPGADPKLLVGEARSRIGVPERKAA